MASALEIRKLVEAEIENTGIFLVDVQVSAKNQIVVEIDRDEGIKIADCASISRFIEGSLDREKEDFELQVSSPGIDKPLKVLRQYHKNIGRDLEVSRLDGSQISGKLTATDELGITLFRSEKVKEGKKKVEKTEEIRIPFNEIRESKIVIKF